MIMMGPKKDRGAMVVSIMKKVGKPNHYEDGKITSNEEEWQRSELLGDAKVDDPNGNEQEETKEQQERRKIYDLEMKCHE